MRMIDKECGRQGPGNAAAGNKPGDRDCNFLKENREERTDDSAAERDQQRHPLRRLLHEIDRDLEPDCEAERCDEQPEKFSSKEQNRYADDDADDRDGKIHFFIIASRFALNSVPAFHSGNLSPLATW